MAKTNIEDVKEVEGQVVEETPVEENLVLVEKENIFVKAWHGVKAAWHKTPKSVKIGVGVLVASGAALAVGGKLIENSLAKAGEEDEDEDDYESCDETEEDEVNEEVNDSEEVEE